MRRDEKGTHDAEAGMGVTSRVSPRGMRFGRDSSILSFGAEQRVPDTRAENVSTEFGSNSSRPYEIVD